MSSSAPAVSFADYLESRRVAVDAALDTWLPKEIDCPAALVRAMRYAVFPGGKRLRPILVLLASEACGGTDEAAMPAACAAEMVHCYSLVHDDLPSMDDDDLRRGRLTCHRAFGEALAILAGDALLTLAFEIVARYSVSPDLAAACCAELAAAAGAGGMVGGQVDDMAATGGEGARPGSVQALESIHRRKTGALLSACVRMGGLVAGAGPETTRALDGYGRCIGLAFQITDDLLDVLGQESAMGKRVGKDDGCGKWTYPAFVGTDQSRQMARDLCREACALLEPLGDRADRLKELARFIVERDR